MSDQIDQEARDHLADTAMGYELMAIEVEEKLEWAEAQGRTTDALVLNQVLTLQLHELADVVEHALTRAA